MKNILIPLLLILFSSTAESQSIKTRVLKDNLFIPWEIVYGPDNHLWFTQKNGFICRMDTAGTRTDTLLYEPTTATIKETGMLGMVLHPDFIAHPYVYVAWEYLQMPDSIITERICRYTYNFAANSLSERFVLIDSIRGHKYHNGCRLQIADNKLFATIADAANNDNPQNVNTINGKIIRINLDGSIPEGNPIYNSPIWSWGHRNPQGLVYANGKLYSSEHGPNTDDEINIIKPGRNYGWPMVRGYCDLPAESSFCDSTEVTEPISAWTPTIAPCGIDYYDYTLFPQMKHSLLLTTLKNKHLYCLKLNEDGTQITESKIINEVNHGRLRDLCISPDGKIFLTTSNSDPNGGGPYIDKIIVLESAESGTDPRNDFLIYPNPAANFIHINIPDNEEKLTYTITSEASGKRFYKGTLNISFPGIDISELPTGTYCINIANGKNIVFSQSFLHLR